MRDNFEAGVKMGGGMAKIVYGVSGEGSGHSSRARVMAGHLVKTGHEVKIVSYDRGYRNLKEDFDLFEIEGLHIASSDNRVNKIKTFTDNFQRLGKGHKRFQSLRREIFKGFKPDCVITDFEPTTAYLATHYHLPLITIDNQHRLRYMSYVCPDPLQNDRLLTVAIIRAMVPRPDVSLVTTFYFGELKNDRTFLFPPILRDEVLALEASEGEHILVYLTSGFESFIDQLAAFPQEQFIVYGYDKDGPEGNLVYKRPSKTGFLNDLASCKAVMATAGFTLMTEALFLRKPYLALPMAGQFEQEINAHFLSELNYGMALNQPSKAPIEDFLRRLPELKNAIGGYTAVDNSAICNKLDALLADNCALAREYHQRRNQSG